MVVWIQWKAPYLMETWSSADLTIACISQKSKRRNESMRKVWGVTDTSMQISASCIFNANLLDLAANPSFLRSGTTLIFQRLVKIRAGLQSEVSTVTTRARCHTSMKTQSELAGLLPSLCPQAFVVTNVILRQKQLGFIFGCASISTS